jgi:ASC-1-like (ASCH) protein
MRIFTPQVLALTGAKLSKSLLREQGKGVLPADVEPWMLDTATWPGSVDDYVDALVWLVGELLTDPKHFFRSFTVKELGRLMTARPTEAVVRAHEMGIYKRYFDLIATGRKTTVIRVNDSSRKKIKVGSLIRFRCQGDEVLTRVTRVVRYDSLDAMFDHESVASVNRHRTRRSTPDRARGGRTVYDELRGCRSYTAEVTWDTSVFATSHSGGADASSGSFRGPRDRP